MLKKVDGKWAIVSKSSGKALAYYKGDGKPDEEWVKKQERRIQFYKHKGEHKIMKTYQDLMEGKPKKWADIKDRNTKKEASQFLKALDVGQVLGYSIEHQEFYIYNSEKDFKNAQKGTKGKAMQWVKVEEWIRHGLAMNEAYKPSFSFKAAVKVGMLQKDDEKPILSMKKMGWDIYEFILTSKGFALTMINKDGKKLDYIDKRPDYVLQKADKTITKKRGKF